MKRIYEFTQFMNTKGQDSNLQGMFVTDPAVTFDPYNKHLIDNVAANKMLMDTMKSLMNTSDFFDNFFSSQSENFFHIEELKIQRISKTNFNIDLYFSFVFNEEEYFGFVKNYNTPNPIIKCELYTKYSRIFTKEFGIKFNGMLLKAFKSFFLIKNGKYQVLKVVPIINIITGDISYTKLDSVVNVINCSNDTIFIEINDSKEVTYKITNLDYYYFNYFFAKLLRP